jgi:hypothetical protein
MRPQLGLLWRSLLAVLILAMGGRGLAIAATPFSGWAVVVVAGDDQAAHEDTPTQAFDNARRDVAAALVRRGFASANIEQFSLHPDRYPADHVVKTDFRSIARHLDDLAARAPDGCLVYFTSHGSPDGVVVDDHIVPPAMMAMMVRHACGLKPTAVILSACFSGVFVPSLAAPNRFVFTAARRDRSSFGCSENDRYPFFDGCVIEDLPASRDFVDLADRVKRCVAAREDSEGMRPRSRPQLSVGAGFTSRMAPFAASPG